MSYILTSKKLSKGYDILKILSIVSKISEKEITGKSRKLKIVEARHVLRLLLSKNGYTRKEINYITNNSSSTDFNSKKIIKEQPERFYYLLKHFYPKLSFIKVFTKNDLRCKI